MTRPINRSRLTVRLTASAAGLANSVDLKVPVRYTARLCNVKVYWLKVKFKITVGGTNGTTVGLTIRRVEEA